MKTAILEQMSDFYKYRKIRGEFYTLVKFRHPFEFYNFAVLLHHFYSTFTLNFAPFAAAAEAIFLIFTHSPPLKGGDVKIKIDRGEQFQRVSPKRLTFVKQSAIMYS